MPEAALHFSVVFALASPRFGVKKAFLLSILAVLPDLDVLLYVHRSLSHSIPVLLAPSIPVLLVIYSVKPKYLKFAIFCLMALLTHPTLDCFQTYTPILYPLVDRSFWINVEGSIFISPSNFAPRVSAEIVWVSTVFTPFEATDAPIFTSVGLLVSAMLIIPTLLFTSKPLGQSKGNDVKFGPVDHSPIFTYSLPFALSAEDITVVLPALDEEQSIGKVINELKGNGYANIIVVDGYSSDKTVEIAKDNGVNVILQRGKGKAGAVGTAIESVKTSHMLFMDADLTYDPADIKRMLTIAPEYDEVIGMRTDRENIPWVHRIGNRVISLLFSLLMGKRVNDPCSGMYLLKTERARNLELTSCNFDVEVELAGQMCAFGKVKEVPISYRKRMGSRKLNTWRDGFNVVMAILKLSFVYNPVFLFSALAGFAAVPGSAILLQQLTLRYFYGGEVWSLGWTWLGLIFLVVGLQGLTLATISLLLKRMERRIIQKNS